MPGDDFFALAIAAASGDSGNAGSRFVSLVDLRGRGRVSEAKQRHHHKADEPDGFHD
jgi:hypothetical protein